MTLSKAIQPQISSLSEILKGDRAMIKIKIIVIILAAYEFDFHSFQDMYRYFKRRSMIDSIIIISLFIKPFTFIADSGGRN